ncbi:unnamed protein product, partial [Owenia fusiformis]
FANLQRVFEIIELKNDVFYKSRGHSHVLIDRSYDGQFKKQLGCTRGGLHIQFTLPRQPINMMKYLAVLTIVVFLIVLSSEDSSAFQTRMAQVEKRVKRARGGGFHARIAKVENRVKRSGFQIRYANHGLQKQQV